MDTLAYLDKERLKASDDNLRYLIFKELSSDAVSFLHQWTVDRLIESNKIPEDVRSEILNLRTRILYQLEKTSSIEEYRSESNWEKIRNQAEEIMVRIKKRHYNKT